MIYQFDHFEVDIDNFTLSIDGRSVAVEPLVFNVIAFLIEKRDKLVTRQEIFDNIWPDKIVSDAALSNHIKSARRSLGDDGSRQKYIKTIHGRGYQFVGQATEIETEIDSDKLAVLPFTNLRRHSHTDYFGFSIADQIIGQLIYLQRLSVTPSALIRQFENSSVNPMKIGKQLEVDYLLVGNYFVDHEEIRLNMELINLQSRQTKWRESIQIDFKDVFQLQDKIASKIAFELNLQFTPENRSSIENDISKNPLAYEYYLKSISYPLGNDGHKLAIDMLEKSILLDPEYSPAYVMLGRHKRLLAQHGRVEDSGSNDTEGYFLKALSLNPNSLLALGYLAVFYTEINEFEKASDLVAKMIEINPNNAETHFTRGYIYRYIGLLDDSIKEMELALSIEPNNSSFRSIVTSCFCAGDYQRALDWIHLDQDSDYQNGWHGIISYYTGEHQMALEKFTNARKLDPNGIFGLLANIFQGFIENDFEKSKLAIERAENSTVIDSENMCFLAMFYAEIGENKRAISMLNKAIDSGYSSYPLLNSNSSFEKLKSYPEFHQIIDRVKQNRLDFQKYLAR